MSNPNYQIRPSPETLLEAIKGEDKRNRRKGYLKLFLGMAAGVGKTYAMLEEAQILHREGVDLVVGIVDTHARPETAQLLDGLEIIPAKKIIYRDHEFEELDLKEVLKRHPQLVLIDELAHTNVPGSLHEKRWQDVLEILDNGINVFTTLNVQHIESLKDVVESIASVTVRETVPDSMIATATFIQLVDLTPDELLQRLREGKVYLGDQSQLASKHFFQKDRLTALREIVLRYTAEQVDHDLHGMVPTTEQTFGWKPREHLLVAVDHSPESQKLIRSTRRFAFNLDAPWVAVHVYDGRILDESESNVLNSNLSLARDLGAEVITTNDPDIAEGIQRIARQKGVTQIVLGKSPERPFLSLFRPPSLLRRLTKEWSDVDIHLIRQEPFTSSSKWRYRTMFMQIPIYSYLMVTLFVCALALFGYLIDPFTGYHVIGMLFLFGILLMSLFFKLGPILFGSILSAIIWIYLYIPSNNVIIGANEDTILLILFFLTAIVTGTLVNRAKEHKELLAKREESTQAQYDIVRYIASARSKNEIFSLVQERLGKELNGIIEIFIKRIDNGIVFTEATKLKLDDKEQSVALWSFENGKEAGWSTTTLPSAKNLYIPLNGPKEIVGVLAFHPNENRVLSFEDINFLHTVAHQLSNYLERTFTEERTRRIDYLNQIEKIYQTVLKSISTELQSPLSSIQEAIQVAVSSLSVEPEKKEVAREIHKIENSSEKLLTLLDNVSLMAKLGSAVIPLNKSKHNVSQLINNCVEKFKTILGERRFNVKIDQNLPLVDFDLNLMELLLHNIITNAIENSPSDSIIEIEAKRVGSRLLISISDQGKGIPNDLLNTVFEKFYRLPGTTTPGIGLGLSIAKRIAEIHHGNLKAENRPGGGSVFTLTLPIE